MPWRIKNAEQTAIESQTSETSAQHCVAAKQTGLQQSHHNVRSETRIDIAFRYYIKN